MYTDLYTVSLEETGLLSLSGRPRGHEWLEDEINAWGKSGVTHVISLLELKEALDLGLRDEAFFTKQAQMRFTNYCIPDMQIPLNINDFIDLALNLSQEIQSGEWVHIHCRAGIGRSGVMASTVLYFLGYEPEQALHLVSQCRKLQIPDTEEQKTFILNLPQLIEASDSIISH